MTSPEQPGRKIRIELDALRARLREAEETLAAIRNGEVDALVVNGPGGDHVFTLRGAEQPYRIFVEKMSDGALTMTMEGTILYANGRMAAMLRAPLEKIISSSVFDWVDPTDVVRLKTLLATGEAGAMEGSLRALSGGAVNVNLSTSVMPLDEITAVGIVVTDLTERRERKELEAARAALEQQNLKLRQTQQLMEAAASAKDQFLAALSHELRTPLTPVLMAAAGLGADKSLSKGAREHAEVIQRNVELEARLIDDLLDLTRIARGKLELHTSPVDVHAVLVSALETCAGELLSKHIKLERRLDARRSTVLGDSVRLQQIFWNVFRNAVKFSPAGSTIDVRTRNVGEQMEVRITDSGIGIDVDALDRIFEPFEQADRGITRQFGGLGMGLAISRRLAELHGGTIVAESPGRGQGATFVITLTSLRNGAAQNKRQSPRKGSTNGRTAMRALSILLVEDHDDTRSSLTRLLTSMGHRVYAAQDSRSAMKAAAGDRFDIVISDIGLPDGSGLELMRHLRAVHRLEGICISGYGMEEDVSRSHEAGFVEHLTKPVKLDQLERVIAGFVATR